MTLEQAIKNNPYDSNIGKIGAYCRYLRYNVDNWYDKKSEEVREIYIKHCEESQK